MNSSPNHRGFNLIEAAIVLGVIGLVIAGIWIAASSVTRAQRVQQTFDGFLLIAERLSQIYSKGNVTDTCAIGEASVCTLTLSTQQLSDMGILPDGWTVRADGTLDSPIFPNITILIIDPRYGGSDVWGNPGIWIMNSSNATDVAGCKKVGVLALQNVGQGKTFMGIDYGSSQYAMTSVYHGVTSWETDASSGSGVADPLLGTRPEDCSGLQMGFSF